jgi:hypothetical protein
MLDEQVVCKSIIPAVDPSQLILRSALGRTMRVNIVTVVVFQFLGNSNLNNDISLLLVLEALKLHH